MFAESSRALSASLAVVIVCAAAGPGCRGSAEAATSLVGMTVAVLGEHIKKHHQMSDVALASVMGESALEIFANPTDGTAPKLVVSWSVNDDGEPAVEHFAFTEKKIPAVDDEEAVIAFCQKLLRAGNEE